MQINITARRISVTEPFKITVNEKLTGLKKHNSTIEKARAIFSQEKSDYVSEIVLTGRRFRMVCLGKEPDLKASFDRCILNLENRLKKLRSRTKERKSKGTGAALSGAAAQKSDSQPGGRRIIRVESFATKPMSPEEATLELDLLKKEFIVFRNSESEGINVLYRRKDGNFGLIEE